MGGGRKTESSESFGLTFFPFLPVVPASSVPYEAHRSTSASKKTKCSPACADPAPSHCSLRLAFSIPSLEPSNPVSPGNDARQLLHPSRHYLRDPQHGSSHRESSSYRQSAFLGRTTPAGPGDRLPSSGVAREQGAAPDGSETSVEERSCSSGELGERFLAGLDVMGERATLRRLTISEFRQRTRRREL